MRLKITRNVKPFRSQVSKWDSPRNPHGYEDGEGEGERGGMSLSHWISGQRIITWEVEEITLLEPRSLLFPFHINWFNVVVPILQMVKNVWCHVNSFRLRIPNLSSNPSPVDFLRKTRVMKCRNVTASLFPSYTSALVAWWELVPLC